MILVVIALEEELPGPVPSGYKKLVTGVGKVNATIQICEMEAYALAKVATKFGIPFDCYKYISDSDADGEEQGNEWRDNVHKGAELFRTLILIDKEQLEWEWAW